MNPETKRVLTAWSKQFGVVLVFYLAALAAATLALRRNISGTLGTLLVLAPIVPGLVLVGFTVRSYRRCDEFIQRRILQSASLITVILAALSLVYGFLEPLGAPRLSAAWLSGVIWGLFVLQMVRLIATGR